MTQKQTFGGIVSSRSIFPVALAGAFQGNAQWGFGYHENNTRAYGLRCQQQDQSPALAGSRA